MWGDGEVWSVGVMLGGVGSRIGALLDALELQLGVVAQLSTTDLGLASACEGWTVREVLGHSLGVTHKLAAFAAGVTDAPRTPRADLIGGDPVGAFEREIAYARAVWPQVAPDRVCVLPFGSFGVNAVAGLNQFDVMAHCWDVAVVVGIDLDPNDRLWVVALDAAREIIGSGRDSTHYGVEQVAGDGVDPMWCFLAYLGRHHPSDR